MADNKRSKKLIGGIIGGATGIVGGVVSKLFGNLSPDAFILSLSFAAVFSIIFLSSLLITSGFVIDILFIILNGDTDLIFG